MLLFMLRFTGDALRRKRRPLMLRTSGNLRSLDER
jgi:hypothetical protein